MRFKVHDRVVLTDQGIKWAGIITIISDMGCKVLFDDGDGPNYWYYKEEELEPEIKDDNRSE